MLCTRRWSQYVKVIAVTSLFWCSLDIFIINYFSNCNSGVSTPQLSGQEKHFKQTTKRTNLIDSLIDRVPKGKWSLSPV